MLLNARRPDQHAATFEQLHAKYGDRLLRRMTTIVRDREIARQGGIPLGTVMSRIHTAKGLLRQVWHRRR
jgi:DNA-directed RNA polymerase specialized sigma24 family protein